MTVLAEVAERAHRAAAGAGDEVLAAAGRHALDTMACVASGATHPLAARWLPLMPWPADLETAVEIQATLAHVDEFDALHVAAGVAPGAVVVPAALALGAAVGASGEAVARAIVAGYEAVIEAALRFGGAQLYEAGWWPTALFGALGSAAGCAELLGLDCATATSALALAASGLGGLLGSDMLGDGHYLLCGRAAALGTRAARGAQAGLTASASLLDGPAASALGRRAAPASPPGPHLMATALKRWPCARPLHAVLAALEALEAAGEAPAAGDTVDVALPSPVLRFITAERDPAGPAEAAASVAVAVGGAAAGRADDPGWYRDVGLGRVALPEIGIRVRSLPSLDARFPGQWGALVVVRSPRGTARRRALTVPGDPAQPIPAEDLIGKAARLMCVPVDAPIVAALLGLAAEQEASLVQRELCATIVPGKVRAPTTESGGAACRANAGDPPKIRVPN